MKRNLSETLPRPTAGCLPVPLFNQKRRSRLPLTSNPSENEFCRNASNGPAESLASPSLSSGNSGNSDGSAPNYIMSAGQNSTWNRQQGQMSNRPAASSAGRGLAPLAHPVKTGNAGLQTGQQRPGPRQGPGAQPDADPCGFPDDGGSFKFKSQPSHAYAQSGPQSAQHRQPALPGSFRAQQPQRPATTPPPPRPPSAGSQWQDLSWEFKTTPHRSQLKEDNPGLPSKSVTQPQRSPAPQTKPAADSSLRLLTTVIGGMKHWSQYRDRVPCLFEVFATLDSAVTVGDHGAKSFRLRDGKDVAHCVFYETDRDLPRLIRGQVHRCVGNYQAGRDLLTCVSVRPASPSEQRNHQRSVGASDAEMRRLVQSLSEI